MAESKFLRWQDKNGDNLIDVCEIDLPRAEKVCLDCIPNPRATVPRWRKRTLHNPFLNGKLCKYQITNVTAYTNTGSGRDTTSSEARAKLNERFEEYERETVEALLNYFNKDDSEESINKILEAIEHTDYHLDARPHSHLKLLYSIPFSALNDLEDAAAEEEEEPAAGDIVTTYIPSILDPNMIRVRKGLHLYASNLKVFRALEGKNLVFEEGGLFNLDLYGDFVLWGSSITEGIIPQLSDFLSTKNLTLGTTSMFFPTVFGVTKFECTFTPEYKLKQLRAWPEGCGDKPAVFKGKKLDPLNVQPAFKDPTAMAYFSKIDEMERDLTSRVPKPWIEFIKEYTYPKVTEATRALPGETEGTMTALSCVSESLAGDTKQLGQDILDDVFSIGDAIAAQFHRMLCEEDYKDFLMQEYSIGKANRPPGSKAEIESNRHERLKNIKAMSIEQAYGEIEEENAFTLKLCTKMISACDASGGSQTKLDLLWRDNLDPIRLCGLFEMTLEAIQCLFKGLTFEEVLASMLKSALKAMSIENFGDLFVGLPPEKQAKLDELVKRKLAAGDLGGPGRIQDTSEGANPEDAAFYAGGKGFFGTMLGTEFEKPWENKGLVERQKTKKMVQESFSQTMTPTGIPAKTPDSNLEKATLQAQLETAGAGLSSGVVMEAYMLALLEEYSDDLLSLVGELEKFPGAPLIATLIATLDCPRPPLFDPSLMDFLKDIELPFCRNTNHIGLPRFENPFAYIPKLWDIFRILWQMVKEQLYALVHKIICRLVVFICELLGDAICKALEVAGQLAASLPALIGGRTTFSDVVRDSICGPDADPGQVEDTIQDMFNSLGAGSAALADKSMVMSFAEDLSSTTSRSELTNAMLGDPSDSFLSIIDSLIEFEYPEFADAFGNPEKASKFFENIGNIMPAEARAALKSLAADAANQGLMPANPSLCATPQEMQKFCNARAKLLEGRASPDQIALMCAAGRDTLKDDLEQLGDVIQNGIPDYFEQNMPSPMSKDPTCDNGLMPYEPQEIAKATTAALNSALEVLKISYSQDMLGNGPFVQSNWGFMNMVMSDTMGWAYTVHQRRSSASGGWFSRREYVDFNVESDPGDTAMNILTMGTGVTALAAAAAGPGLATPAGALAASYAVGTVAAVASSFDADANYEKVSQQRGAFPLYVADYLLSTDEKVGEMERSALAASFNSNNDFEPDQSFERTFANLGFDSLFDEVDLLILPDYGYNVSVKPVFATSFKMVAAIDPGTLAAAAVEPLGIARSQDNFGHGVVVFTRKARKKTPDLKLSFRDNDRGEKTSDDGFSYGFNVELYLADLVAEKHYSPIPEQFFPEEGPSRAHSRMVTSAEEAAKISEGFEQVWLEAQAAAQAAGYTDAGTHVIVGQNRPDDNARIKIEKVLNSSVPESNASYYESAPEETEFKKRANSITTYRAYEFLSVDDGLDNKEYNEGGYTKFKTILDSPSTSIIPQLVLLQEMIEKQNPGPPPQMDALKPAYDQVMNLVFNKFANEISTNEAAFEYGAQLDDLSPAQIEYGMGYEDQFMLFKEYLDATDTDTDNAPLGISRMQYDEENNDGPANRVFYLDPLVYGGSNLNPPVHLKPAKKTGWLGMVDVMFPEMSPCKPQHTDLVDFGTIQEIIDESYSKIPEDERLKSDPDCVTEKPYNRILERASKAGIEGLIHAMCRIFVSFNFLKSLATFTKFYPDFKKNFSSLYAAYVVELMEEELKDAQSNAFLESFSPFKDDEFWYAFLEQTVQTYARKVETGAIEDVPSDALAALEYLSGFQAKYKYPDDNDLVAAKNTGDAWMLQTLKNYRYEKNLEAIKQTEEWAKAILKEFVIQEMEYMAEVFMKNLQHVGIIDQDSMINNLGYYLLESLSANTSLTLNKELKEEVQGLPTEGEQLYTNGQELATPDGEPYTGYYHVHIDEDGLPVYMVGERHSSETHDMLRPFANKVIVPIGSVGSIGGASGTSEKPFVVESYIRLNNDYLTPIAALARLAALPDRSLNISDVYPGTMRLVTDPDTGAAAGTTGELGARYGLRLSFQVGSIKYAITEVEIDVLDLPIEKFQPLESDSKLLLCLINNLVDDDKFRMLTSYIFPLNKVLSTLAIYNDMAFLPSIGETTTDNFVSDIADKPGKYVVVDTEAAGAGARLADGAGGWADRYQRDSGMFTGGGFFELHFDKWNRSVLVKSKARVKKLFNNYYNSRDFDPGDLPDAATSFIASLRATWSLSPGERHFPWFKKSLLRSTPFNANGELCKKSD